MKKLLVLLLVLFSCLALSTPASAGVAASITMTPGSPVAAGSLIHFDVTYPGNVQQPNIFLDCTNGDLITFQAIKSKIPGYPAPPLNAYAPNASGVTCSGGLYSKTNKGFTLLAPFSFSTL